MASTALRKQSPQGPTKSSPKPPKSGAPSKLLPRLISKAIERVPSLVESPAFRYGRSAGDRSMRSERRASILGLLLELVKRLALQFDGAFVAVNSGQARPVTVVELAEGMERTRNCAHECLADLRDMGFIAGTRQRKLPAPGGIEVSGVIRMFTRKFWDALGLWGLFVESVKWAASHGRLKFKMTFKQVRLERKAKRKVQAMAGGLCGLAPDAKERGRNTRLFLEALECGQNTPGGCQGGNSSEEVCAVCQKLGCNR